MPAFCVVFIAQSKDKDLKKNIDKREELEGKVKQKKQEQGKIMREITTIERDIMEKEKELNKKRPHYIKVFTALEICY